MIVYWFTRCRVGFPLLGKWPKPSLRGSHITSQLTARPHELKPRLRPGRSFSAAQDPLCGLMVRRCPIAGPARHRSAGCGRRRSRPGRAPEVEVGGGVANQYAGHDVCRVRDRQTLLIESMRGRENGGGEGIRTLDTAQHRIPAFQASAFNHSATPPLEARQ